jgi:cyclopropane-fatty-acyl-phospholipid synthase
VAEIGLARARIWRFYMAAGAQAFEVNRIQINHVLGVRPDGGRSHMPAHPYWVTSP